MYQSPVLVSPNGHSLDISLDPFWQGLQQLASHVLISLCLSLLLTIALSILSYWFSSTFGIPVMPFFFVVI
ncbi:hypothetical protein RYO59_001600 [Thermosynechococcaceae cyanobacterium Okahandja]